MNETPNTTPPADRETHTSREFAATAADVFAAFRDPVLLARWWGPNDFTNTFHCFDFRPGGRWRFTMHGAGGGDYENESEFLEIVEPSRIVLRHVVPPHFDMTLTFAEAGGRTTVGWHMRFATAEEWARVKAIVIPANEQNLDRLGAVLASRS
jgi:uncharacterized protein YndB with AHSA1/START domain